MTGLIVFAAVAAIVVLWLVVRSRRSKAGAQVSPPGTDLRDAHEAETDSLEGDDGAPPEPWRYEWRARLSFDTPLASLERHGERWAGPGRPGPADPADFGAWTPVDRPPAGAPAPGSPEAPGLPAALYEEDREVLLSYLMAFRRIVEGFGPVDDQIVLVRSLSDLGPDFQRVAAALGRDFPVYWFAGRFTRIHGIGPGTARTLFDAGFRTPDDLDAATDHELLSIHGVGPSMVRQIRSQLPALTAKPRPKRESAPEQAGGRDSAGAAAPGSDAPPVEEEVSRFERTWDLLENEMREFARSGMESEALRTRIRMGELLESEQRGPAALRVYLEVCFRDAVRATGSGETGVWDQAQRAARRLAGDLELDPDQVEQVLSLVREGGGASAPGWADPDDRWATLGLTLLEEAADRGKE